ncbi:hypothetical protein [Cereibacter changlensis]|uniref:hypothetical protein n=1 Tax=Cereibacter changlensis TaxID=402884 RepID=UPI0040338271
MSTAERFLRDVRNHQMTIEHDSGVHRSVHFGRPGSSTYYFRLVTWPGYLSISGDGGCYTFSRLHDMFDFFRFAGPEYDKGDSINEGYWSEKLRAVDRSSGAEDFDDDAYVEAIRGDMAQYLKRFTLSEAKNVVREARWDDLFDAPATATEAIDMAMGWRCPVTNEKPFHDFYEHRLTKTSFRLVWCMRAIQWGIKRYDLQQQSRTQADHDRHVLAGAR